MSVDAAPDLAFALDRFVWRDGAFAIAGRWTAGSSVSLGRCALRLEVGGRRRRVAARDAAAVEAAPEGREWSAAFPWPERPDQVTAAELEIGRDLTVVLPLPEVPARSGRFRRPPERRDGDDLAETLAGERRAAARARAELDAAREQAERVLERLQAEQRLLEDGRRRLEEERRRLESVRPAGAAPRPAAPRRLAGSARSSLGARFGGHAPWPVRAVALGLAALPLLFLAAIVLSLV